MSWLFRNKTRVLILLGGLFLGLALSVRSSSLREDITFFLPDEPDLARQFSVFSLTPPARLIFLELSATDPAAVPRLDEAVRNARTKLTPPLFTAVHPLPGAPNPNALMDLVPSLLNETDLARYNAAAAPETLARSLPLLKDKVLGLQGAVLKEFIPADPLGMLAVFFDRLTNSGLLLKNEGQGPQKTNPPAFANGLASNDGLARLLLLETPLPGMDGTSAQAVTDALADLAPLMPEGVSARAISAHQQTAANIRTIRADMVRVLAASSLALTLVFLVWLRTLSAVPALLLPAFALLGAWGLLLLFGVSLSGITLGFAAVLLGIVADYALHVHCALRAGTAPAQVARKLLRPLGFSLLTTMAAVSVLFFSDLPGMRQVGLFSVLGCASGFVLALLVLPLLYKTPAGQRVTTDTPTNTTPRQTRAPRVKPLAFCGFALCIAAAIWAGSGLNIQGNLRDLGVQDPGLIRTEQDFARRWGGGLRQSAMLVSTGNTVEEALTNAANAQKTLREAFADQQAAEGLASPLALIPPPARQAASRELWGQFARDNGDALRHSLGPGGEASQLGFSDTAFAPFLDRLQAVPRPITPTLLDQAGLGLVRALFLANTGGGGKAGLAVLMLAPDRPALLDGVRDRLPPDSIIFSPTGVGDRINTAVREDFARMGLFALATVALCLAAALRSLGGFLLACVPSLCGCAALLLVFGLGGRPLNLFTVAAMPLVIGLCAEYGIFMARHMAQPDAISTPRAILLSGLTTLTGFGSLVLADHPALHTLGLTVGVGIGAAIPAALWLVPLLTAKEKQP